jgi:uncharacterized MAPEG superfamily protein
MTPELTALTLAALLQTAQFYLMAVPTNLELSPGKTLSPRDPARLGGDIRTLVSPKTGRLIRAWDNHFESLALFTIACLVITLTDQSTPFTAACAYIYVAARALYIPAYYFGLVPWRSLIWFTAFTATTLMLLAALL